MDNIFILLLILGFVGGLFRSLRKSAKSFFALLITSLIFFALLPCLAEISGSINLFKKEFVEKTASIFSKIDIMNASFNSQEYLNFITKQPTESVLMKMLSKISASAEGGEKICDVVSAYLYKILSLVFLMFFSFVLIYIITKIMLNICFIKGRCGDPLFVTKRVLAGFFGFARIFVLIVSFLNIAYLLSELSGINIAVGDAFLLNEAYYKNISTILCGYV